MRLLASTTGEHLANAHECPFLVEALDRVAPAYHPPFGELLNEFRVGRITQIPCIDDRRCLDVDRIFVEDGVVALVAVGFDQVTEALQIL